MISTLKINLLFSIFIGIQFLNSGSISGMEREALLKMQDVHNKMKAERQQIQDHKHQIKREILSRLFEAEGFQVKIAPMNFDLNKSPLVARGYGGRKLVGCIPFPKHPHRQDGDSLTLSAYKIIRQRIQVDCNPRIIGINELEDRDLGLTVFGFPGPYVPVFRPIIVDKQGMPMMISGNDWVQCSECQGIAFTISIYGITELIAFLSNKETCKELFLNIYNMIKNNHQNVVRYKGIEGGNPYGNLRQRTEFCDRDSLDKVIELLYDDEIELSELFAQHNIARLEASFLILEPLFFLTNHNLSTRLENEFISRISEITRARKDKELLESRLKKTLEDSIKMLNP